MNTVTLGLSSIDQVKQRLAAAFDGQAQGAHLTFSSVDLLWRVLTPNRWAILQVLTGQGPLSIREVARRLQRDVKSVHTDVKALVTAGLVDQTDDGIEFPYSAVHVDFTLEKAA